MIARLSQLRKFLVSLDIDQNNASEIFALRGNTLSEISEKLLNYTFTEFDGSSPIDNILGELLVHDISATFTAGSTKGYIPIR